MHKIKTMLRTVFKSSDVAREATVGTIGVQIMDNSHVDNRTRIDSYTYIGYNSTVTATTIGRYCSIANNVSIGVGEHELNQISTNSLFYDNPKQILLSKPCTIGNDVWIGVDSIIRRGITIGNGAVIGANSFVNTNVPPYAIVAGSPATLIKYRFTPEQIARIESSKWWEHDLIEAKAIMQDLEKQLH